MLLLELVRRHSKLRVKQIPETRARQATPPSKGVELDSTSQIRNDVLYGSANPRVDVGGTADWIFDVAPEERRLQGIDGESLRLRHPARRQSVHFQKAVSHPFLHL